MGHGNSRTNIRFYNRCGINLLPIDSYPLDLRILHVSFRMSAGNRSLRADFTQYFGFFGVLGLLGVTLLTSSKNETKLFTFNALWKLSPKVNAEHLRNLEINRLKLFGCEIVKDRTKGCSAVSPDNVFASNGKVAAINQAFVAGLSTIKRKPFSCDTGAG